MDNKNMDNKKYIGVYVHIPFCIRKCNYCDFLSQNNSDEIKDKYVKALIKEIEIYSKELTDYKVYTIYIGGGTPSCIDASLIRDILDAIYTNMDVYEHAEVSMEVNPGTLLDKNICMYKQMGINRISMGLQSANNEELKVLGRIHTYEEFVYSHDKVRKYFDNVNIDVMSAIPNQTVESYEDTLKKVVNLKPEHISSYSLIIEEGTYFYSIQDKLNLVSEDEERTMYYMTNDILMEYGYHRYEISNYAKIGMESKHNSSYWIGKEYIGFGLGASSYVDKQRYDRIRDIKEYIEIYNNLDIDDVSKIKGKVECNIQTLSEREQIEEYMFLGLRMIKGVSKSEFYRRFNKNIEDVYKNVIDKYMAIDMIEEKGDNIRLTDRGIDVSNTILADFII